ncbi:MAG: peptidyl-prolyl cis-trans isomerase [Gammaproteobacteria bacterium]|nr:peptidyl-prolyl cis-trans isomerase [Gammaproteobacteria bacterium]
MRYSIVFLMLLFSSLTYSAETPLIHIQTNSGVITIELDAEKAPKTVENFLRYTREGFYDGTIFHRVIDGFMIQGGGFTKDYQQKETHSPVVNEADNGLKNVLGTIAMARTSEPHSATAQFFINVKDNDFLNYSAPTQRGWGYTVFGKVVAGIDVVDKIKGIKTGRGGPFPTDVPQIPVIIEKVSIAETKTPAEK